MQLSLVDNRRFRFLGRLCSLGKWLGIFDDGFQFFGSLLCHVDGAGIFLCGRINCVVSRDWLSDGVNICVIARFAVDGVHNHGFVDVAGFVRDLTADIVAGAGGVIRARDGGLERFRFRQVRTCRHKGTQFVE